MDEYLPDAAWATNPAHRDQVGFLPQSAVFVIIAELHIFTTLTNILLVQDRPIGARDLGLQTRANARQGGHTGSLSFWNIQTSFIKNEGTFSVQSSSVDSHALMANRMCSICYFEKEIFF